MPQDPGVRLGAPDAGGALPGLGTAERNFVNAALRRFQAIDPNLADSGISNSPASDYSSDIVNLKAFMGLLAGSTPAASTTLGQQAFINIGCNLCHIPQHSTTQSVFTNQSDHTFSRFGDFALHDMGFGLANHLSRTTLLRETPAQWPGLEP